MKIDDSTSKLPPVTVPAGRPSTTGEAAPVKQAKAEGLPVTCEVAPHHLLFNHAHQKLTTDKNRQLPPLKKQKTPLTFVLLSTV